MEYKKRPLSENIIFQQYLTPFSEYSEDHIFIQLLKDASHRLMQFVKDSPNLETVMFLDTFDFVVMNAITKFNFPKDHYLYDWPG